MAFVKLVDMELLKKVLHRWAVAVTGLPVGQVAYDFDYYHTGDLAATRPKKPFVSIRVTGPEQVGLTDDLFYVTANNVTTRYLLGHRLFKVSVQVFADDEMAGMYAAALACSFQQEQFYSVITQNNVGTVQAPVRIPLAVRTVYPVRDLTQFIDTKWERRALLEFNLGTVFSNLPSEAGSITTVEITGQLQASLSPVHDVALTVSKP